METLQKAEYQQTLPAYQVVLRSLKIKRLIEIQNFELVEFFSVVIYQRIIYCEESKLDIIIGKKTFTLSTEKQKQNKTNISP